MPKFLELKGQRLPCNDVMPLGLFFDLAEAMDSGTELKQVAAMSKTLKAIVTAEARPVLDRILYDTKDPLTFDDLNAALGKVIPEYTQRPTSPPSDSQAGPERAGGMSSRVFHWGEQPEKRTSGKAGPSAAH